MGMEHETYEEQWPLVCDCPPGPHQLGCDVPEDYPLKYRRYVAKTEPHHDS